MKLLYCVQKQHLSCLVHGLFMLAEQTKKNFLMWKASFQARSKNSAFKN